MKSFKYKGTPEQMKKVEEYLLSKGYTQWANSSDGDFLKCTLDDGDFFYASIGEDYEYCALSKIPPKLELEIFGSTESITGKVENPWIENTGVEPDFFYDMHIDVMLSGGSTLQKCDQDGFMWSKGNSMDLGYLPITYWRYSKPDEEYFVQPTTPTQEDKGRVINMTEAIEIAKDSVPEESINKGPVKSDGGSTSYYQLTIKTKNGTFQCETGDVIAAMVGDNFPLGNAVKAIRRIYQASLGMGKEGIDMEYDAKKIAYFLRDFIDRSKL